MSVQALSWVFDHSPTQGTDRLVLLSIANHAGSEPVDGAWEAWPGVDRLQRLAGLERKRTVNDALGRLIAAGALTRKINGAPDARIPADRRPNLYRILLAHGVTQDVNPLADHGMTSDAPRGDVQTSDGVTPGDLTGCRDASPKPSGNRTEEPSVEPSGEIVRFAGLDSFDIFWSAYPRHTARRSAVLAWPRALQRAADEHGGDLTRGVAAIIAGAKRYSDDPNREVGFTAHPATWLNGDRWNDDPLPPRAATSKVDRNRATLQGALDRARSGPDRDRKAIG